MVKRSRPFQSAVPASASISRRIALATVDLPEPDSPTTASTSPFCSSKRDLVERVEGAVGLAGALDLQDRLGAPDRGVHLARARGRRRSACGCRDAWRGGRSRRACRPRRSRRAFITTTRSATSATTPRSWVISTSPMPISSCSSSSSLSTSACTVTSSAVVGSSAMTMSGLHRQRHGDHHPLALAAGELVRVLVAARLRARGCRRGASARARAPRPATPVMPCTRITSSSCQPTV